MKKKYEEPHLSIVGVQRMDTLCAASTEINGGEPGIEGIHSQAKNRNVWFYLESEDSEEEY